MSWYRGGDGIGPIRGNHLRARGAFAGLQGDVYVPTYFCHERLFRAADARGRIAFRRRVDFPRGDWQGALRADVDALPQRDVALCRRFRLRRDDVLRGALAP